MQNQTKALDTHATDGETSGAVGERSGEVTNEQPRMGSGGRVDLAASKGRLWEMTTTQGLGLFLHLLDMARIDRSMELARIAERTIGHLQNPKSERMKSGVLEALMREWYEGLASGTAPYHIYARREYLAEVWACWWVYSRRYMREMASPTVLRPQGIAGPMEEGALIVDLGNGLGITSAAFRQAFPMATVIGTNILSSDQAKVARCLASAYGFALVERPADVGRQADLAFASEYFEHFEDPIEHLREVFKAIRPKRLIIANAFTAKAIGHFNVYKRLGEPVAPNVIGKEFAKEMRSLGYSKVETGLWNNRPQTWTLR